MVEYVLIERLKHTPISSEQAILELLKGNRVDSSELNCARLAHIRSEFDEKQFNDMTLRDVIYFYHMMYRE